MSSRPTLVLGSSSPARLTTLRQAGIEPVVVVSGLDEDAELARARELYGDLEPADVALVLAKAKAEAVARLLEQDESDGQDESNQGADDDSGVAVDPDDAGLASASSETSAEASERTSAETSARAPVDPADALVLGCDSVLELDGELHGKPADAAEATARWRRMRGRSGVLHTGHWLVDLRDDDHGGTGATLGASASTTVHFADVTDDEIAAYVATGEPLQVAGAFTTDGLGGAFVRGIEGDHHTVVGLSLPLLRILLADCGVRWTDLWVAAQDATRP